MPNHSRKYETKHLNNIRKAQKRVQSYYYKAIDKIMGKAGNLKLKGETFRISSYPTLKNYMDEVLGVFRTELTIELHNAIRDEWLLSNEKNDRIFQAQYTNIIDEVRVLAFDPNLKALEAFENRRKGGLNLSDRVWNYTNQFRNEIEQGLYAGISEGRSAASMAREQKQYLKEPDKLFRRVRDAKGKLVLSKAAKEYHPGQGVYRSSYKNALRLTRNEINTAYRTADHERWSNTPWVIGIEVKLSQNHKEEKCKYHICESLVGIYPKDYKHTGFHTNCLCYSVAIQASKEEFDKYQDAVLSGTEKGFKFSGVVQDVPDGAKDWVIQNSERIQGWKNLPVFMKDNPSMKDYLI